MDGGAAGGGEGLGHAELLCPSLIEGGAGGEGETWSSVLHGHGICLPDTVPYGEDDDMVLGWAGQTGWRGWASWGCRWACCLPPPRAGVLFFFFSLFSFFFFVNE